MASQSRGSSSPNSRATTQFTSSAARRLLSRCRKTVLYALAMLSTVFFVMLVAWATSSDERGAALLREDSLGHHILMERVIPHITATHTGAVRDDRLSAVVVNGASRSRHPWRAYFIAMNLFNNAALIPRFAENLAMFISEELRRKGSVDVPARVFISIFSNGNSDTTSEDINNILVPALEAAGVPRNRRMHVVPSGTACGGFQRKPKHMDRIVWMACIRNEAMRPLYDEGLGLFDPNRRARSSSDQSSSVTTALQVEGDSATPVLNESALPPHYLELPLPDGSTLTSDNTVVLFLNDIVFLPSDMTKLLETNYARSQRLVNYNKRWRSHQKLSKKDGNTDDPNINNNNEGEGEEEPLLTTERGFSSLWDGFNMACGMDFYASFYDQWVTRDYDGRPFDAYPPYARDFGTQQIFYEAEALRSSGASHHVNDHQPRHTAAPARCCWNGAAAIRSSMFLRHDIRFRMPVSNMFNMSRGSDSCYSSECIE
ncbi:Hypothetical protein, putative [Bodo saltans]|uniref:Uncharacterized protein n=1 Tax=Bodo saltans TaxID=75058 RepID=A0A0S4JNQ8_BODSA|nr:Hypothetical protein, putative [Bodo saltans]|eukprot:CUG91775.1 Hypothetical protein, putative [Bodo saltans]